MSRALIEKTLAVGVIAAVGGELSVDETPGGGGTMVLTIPTCHDESRPSEALA